MPKNDQIWPAIGIFVHFGPNIGIFGPFRPMPNQKTMRTRCLGDFSVLWVSKILFFSLKITTFCPKDQIWPEIGIFYHFRPGLAGSFGALLVGCLVVVARWLYLARHLFTLSLITFSSSLPYLSKYAINVPLRSSYLYLHVRVVINNFFLWQSPFFIKQNPRQRQEQ